MIDVEPVQAGIYFYPSYIRCNTTLPNHYIEHVSPRPNREKGFDVEYWIIEWVRWSHRGFFFCFIKDEYQGTISYVAEIDFYVLSKQLERL